MAIPPVTLSTACFYLGKYHSTCRSIEQSIEGCTPLLRVPCYLVIYCNRDLLDHVKAVRQSFGLDHLTRYVVQEMEEIWTYGWKEKVVSNREVYWPTRDARAGWGSHLVCSNKADFVLQTMRSNPFGTAKFGWIDSNIGPGGSKISTHYSDNLLPYVLQNIGDKFRIQILNVVDKRFKKNKREYYERYRWIVCGSFFTLGNNEINMRILNRLKDLYIETTMEGYGHGEEMFYLEILDEFYEHIDRAYGNYKHILHNFIEPTVGHGYVFSQIIRKFLDSGYHRECFDAASSLVRVYEAYKTPIDYDLFVRAYFAKYVAAFYCRRSEARGIVESIRALCDSNPYFKKEFEKRGDFYNSQFSFVA
jgi:hypothetical protein